jgi:hypothetical protein
MNLRWLFFAFSALIALHRLGDIAHQTYSRAASGDSHVAGWIFITLFWLALTGLCLRSLILRRRLHGRDTGHAHYTQDNPRMTVIPPSP